MDTENTSDAAELTLVKGSRFTREKVPLDGFHYTECTFDSVRLTFCGGPFGLTNNNFEGRPMIEAGTPELARFVQLLGQFGYLATFVGTDQGPMTFGGVKDNRSKPDDVKQ